MNKKRLAISAALLALVIFALPAPSVAAEAAPDLSVDNLTVTPVTLSPSDNVTVAFDLSNRGNATVERAYVYFFIDHYGSYQLYYAARGLAPGETESVLLHLHLQLPFGEHAFRVVADPENVLAEESETNNSASIGFAVYAFPGHSPPAAPQTMANLDLSAHDSQRGWSAQMVTLYPNQPAVGPGSALDQTYPNEYNQPLGNYVFERVPYGDCYVLLNKTCPNGTLLSYFANVTVQPGSATANIHMPYACTGGWVDYYRPPPTTTATTTAAATTTTPTTSPSPSTTATTAGNAVWGGLAALALAFAVLRMKSKN